MAFCTECGKQLSDSAVFCPNCGHKRSDLGEASGEEQRINAEVNPAENPEGTEENTEKGMASSVEAEKEAADSTKAESASEPENGWAAGEPAGSTRAESSYGHNTYGNNNMGYKSHEEVEKKNNSKAAIIVIATVVVLLAVAIVLFISLSKGEDFIGYWEAEEVDMGSGFDDELFGHDVKGMFGLQLNEDNTYKLLSAFNSDIVSGPWKETDSGIQLQNQMESIQLSYRNKQLLMQVGNYTFALEHSEGSIDNPTIPAGKYAGSGNELDTPGSSSGGSVPDGGQQPAAPSGSPSVSGSGSVGNGDYYISVVGAEEFTDTEGDPAIRIYYEYTNNFDFPESAYNTIDWEAVQDGESLEFAYSWDDVDVYNNDMLNVRPGLTVQCCIQYKYNPNGGTVEASFFGWSDGKSGGKVLASYVPGQLPGAPAPYVYDPIPDPEWTTSELDSEGYLDNGKCYVEVTDAKLIQDSYGFDAVRVFYRFTNHYNEPVSFYSVTYPIVYQDGVGLPESFAEISTDTDERINTSVEPGQTVEVSCVFRLRNNTSSIEAEVEGVDTYAAVGQTYKIS